MIGAVVRQRQPGSDVDSNVDSKAVTLTSPAFSDLRRAELVQFRGFDSLKIWIPVFVLFFAVYSISLGSDMTWDFKNYHYYNGFAVFHDRSRLDIFPAQLQTAFYPYLDAIYYLLYSALNEHPSVLAVVMSLPYAASATLVFVTARLFVDGSPLWRGLLAASAALIGLTGASAASTLGTAMTDVTPALPALAGLTLWLVLEKQQRNGLLSSFVVGLLAGLSVGLKLTQAPLFIAIGLLLTVRTAWRGRVSLAESALFGAGGMVAFLAADASWLLANLDAYGNPIFPFRNDLFRSDLIAKQSFADVRYVPNSVFKAIFFPVYWAFSPSHVSAELDMRDPRVLVGCLAALAIVGVVGLRRFQAKTVSHTDRLAFSLALAFLAAYGIWEAISSIYRYLVIEEALAAILLLALLSLIGGNRRQIVYGLFAPFVIAIALLTAPPPWERGHGSVAVAVNLPPIEPDAMLLVLGDAPLGYVVPFLPPTARAIGATNNLVYPGAPGRLWDSIARVVRDHRGPLWGIEDPPPKSVTSDLALKALNLTRGDCAPLDSNLESGKTARICRLARVAEPEK